MMHGIRIIENTSKNVQKHNIKINKIRWYQKSTSRRSKLFRNQSFDMKQIELEVERRAGHLREEIKVRSFYLHVK